MDKLVKVLRLKRVWAALGAVAGALGQPMIASVLNSVGTTLGA